MTIPSIVLVEDNPDDVELMMRAFRARETFRCDIRVASDGAAAIETSSSARAASPTAGGRPAGFLKLPGSTDSTCCADFEAIPKTRNLPVVILTSSLEPGDLTRTTGWAPIPTCENRRRSETCWEAAQQIACRIGSS
jgi:CheY-like chemotaxis protein